MNALSAIVAGFLVTVIAIFALRPVALSLALVDRPGGRKTHHGEVPLVGGMAMFFGIVVGIGFLAPPLLIVGPLLAVFSLIVVIGTLDDRFTLSHWTRLFVQFGASAALVMGTNTVVRNMGDPFGIGTILLPEVGAVIFSVALVAAAINAFNMLDGIDGLAGIIALVTLTGLGLYERQAGVDGTDAAICAVVGAAICGFLIFNIPGRFNRSVRCFMGDSGSTLIGVAVAWLAIRMSQLPVHGGVHPVTVMWIVALPLYEIFWTVVRRLLRGRSPFAPDTEHFHHLLRDARLSVRAVFFVFLLLDALLVAAGFLLAALHVPDWVSLLLLVSTGVALVRSMYVAQWIVCKFPAMARGEPAVDL